MAKDVDLIRTAEHVHGVKSAAAFRNEQRRYLNRRNRARAWEPRRDPFKSKDSPLVFIASGKWLIRCTNCGNAPAVAPTFALACCFECGAIYEGVSLPPDAAAIAALLVQRPDRHTRRWYPSQTLDELRAENAAMGIGV